MTESIARILAAEYGISEETARLGAAAEEKCAPYLKIADDIAEYNGIKILKSFKNHNISAEHLGSTTGYGYDDIGRDTLDKVYAEVLGAEDAIVRHSFVNGTHAIATCLFAVLRPGDTLVAATGKPYDTLEEVIGIRAQKGSLAEFGVNYRQVDLKNSQVDFDGLRDAIDHTCKVVAIQRSKGYAWRDSLTVEQIGEIISFVKSIRKDIICIVDNCYGEFVETIEPTEVGADLIVGSLIKNPGGGLAQSGGYIAGSAECVELASYAMTCPGIGRECGSTLGNNSLMYQGFFMAPHTVAQSIKASIFCSALLEEMGYEVMPRYTAGRTDIITAIKLNEADKLIKFCRGIQKGAPIDSFVLPMPWDMPGYESQVIMAAGAFTQGSSIEISADGPLKEPYIAYYQGGLTYESAKVAILAAAENIRR